MKKYLICMVEPEEKFLCFSFDGFVNLWFDFLDQYSGGSKFGVTIEGFLVAYTQNNDNEWDGDPIRVKILEKFGDGKEHFISMDWFVKLMETIYCIKLEED